jgi:hypothetical protein
MPHRPSCPDSGTAGASCQRYGITALKTIRLGGFGIIVVIIR